MKSIHEATQIVAQPSRRSIRGWVGATALAVSSAALLVACGGGGGGGDDFLGLKSHASPTFGSPQPEYPASFANVTPTAFEGNIPGDDAHAICRALLDGRNITGEILGFKSDPPVNDGNDFFGTTVSDDGKYLAWGTHNATMQAVVVKGGPNYHVYDYVGSGITTDSWLASPEVGRGNVPEISHYHVCYTLNDPNGGLGCTPGYWRNHMDRWTGYTPDQMFGAVFGVNYLTNVSLGTVISNPQTYGAFAFHAVAALLNSTSEFADDYAYTTAQVMSIVATGAGGNKNVMNNAKNQLAAANEAGCPLSGSRASR